jgi:RhoGAP domain
LSVRRLNFRLQNVFPGEDPLDGRIDGDDINSVAGLLKLYFRELKDPLFPASVFDQLVECSHKYNINGKSGLLVGVSSKTVIRYPSIVSIFFIEDEHIFSDTICLLVSCIVLWLMAIVNNV